MEENNRKIIEAQRKLVRCVAKIETTSVGVHHFEIIAGVCFLSSVILQVIIDKQAKFKYLSGIVY